MITDTPTPAGRRSSRIAKPRARSPAFVAAYTPRLGPAVRERALASDSPQVLAHLLAALFNEAGMMVAAAEDPDTARQAVRAELDLVLHGLQTGSPKRSKGGAKRR